MDRRAFVAGGIGAVGTAAVAGMVSSHVPTANAEEAERPEGASPIAPVDVPAQWTEEADIVVVGGGIAGLCATLRALECGANVIAIERSGLLGGNSTGSMMFETHGDCTPEEWYNALIQVPNAEVRQNPQIVSRFAYDKDNAVKWFEDMGLSMTDEAYGVKGLGHFTQPADFVPDPNRDADDEGNEVFYKGTVILATGGYQWNDDMLKYYADELAYAGITKRCGVEGDLGDGIRMAEGVGAWIANMWHIDLWNNGADDPEIAANGPRSYYTAAGQLTKVGSLEVNILGERFNNEGAYLADIYSYQGFQRLVQPEMTGYMIFDDSMMSAQGIIDNFHPGWCACPTTWFDDDLADQLSRGVIVKADTLEELAKAIDVPADTFVATVERYNELCAKGYDEDFFKVPSEMVAIDQPPFYAVKDKGCAMLNTWGGIKVNKDMQVIDDKGCAIPGLYACGETATYLAEISRSILSGRAAGYEAASRI